MVEWILVGIGIGFAIVGVAIELATNELIRRRIHGCPECKSRGAHSYDCFYDWDRQDRGGRDA